MKREYDLLRSYRDDPHAVSVIALGSYPLGGDILYGYSSRFLNRYSEHIYNSRSEYVVNRETPGNFTKNSVMATQVGEVKGLGISKIVAAFARLATYFYNPDTGTRIKDLASNAGDINFRDDQFISEVHGTYNVDPNVSVLDAKLIAFRDLAEGVDIPNFMQYLFSLEYLASRRRDIVEDAPYDVWFREGVLNGFFEGMREKYGIKEGEQKAVEWLNAYLAGVERRQIPQDSLFTPDHVRAYVGARSEVRRTGSGETDDSPEAAEARTGKNVKTRESSKVKKLAGNQPLEFSTFESSTAFSRSETRMGGVAIRQHAVDAVSLFPLSQLYAPTEKSYYERKPFEMSLEEVAEDDPAKQMLESGISYWHRQPAFVAGMFRSRLDEFTKYTTVIGVDLPTLFFHPKSERDSEAFEDVTQIMQISFRRRLVFFSKDILASLKPDNPSHQAFVAWHLNIAQTLIDEYHNTLTEMSLQGRDQGVVTTAFEKIHESMTATVYDRALWQDFASGETLASPQSRAALMNQLTEKENKIRARQTAVMNSRFDQLGSKMKFLDMALKRWSVTQGLSVRGLDFVINTMFPTQTAGGSFRELQRGGLTRLQWIDKNLLEMADDLKRLAFFYARTPDANRVRILNEAVLHVYEAIQKIDPVALVPFDAQKRKLYFLMRIGDFPRFQIEFKKLVQAEYVPLIHRESQLNFTAFPLPLWKCEALPDLLYKLQFHRPGQTSPQAIALIEETQQFLLEHYEKALRDEEVSSINAKFNLDFRDPDGVEIRNRSKDQALEKPLWVNVPGTHEVFGFGWRWRRMSATAIRIRVEAFMPLGDLLRRQPVGHLDFVLRRDAKGEWNADAEATHPFEREDRSDQPALLVEPEIITAHQWMPIVLLQLALRIAAYSDVEKFYLHLSQNEWNALGGWRPVTKHGRKFSPNPARREKWVFGEAGRSLMDHSLVKSTIRFQNPEQTRAEAREEKARTWKAEDGRKIHPRKSFSRSSRVELRAHGARSEARSEVYEAVMGTIGPEIEIRVVAVYDKELNMPVDRDAPLHLVKNRIKTILYNRKPFSAKIQNKKVRIRLEYLSENGDENAVWDRVEVGNMDILAIGGKVLERLSRSRDLRAEFEIRNPQGILCIQKRQIADVAIGVLENAVEEKLSGQPPARPNRSEARRPKVPVLAGTGLGENNHQIIPQQNPYSVDRESILAVSRAMTGNIYRPNDAGCLIEQVLGFGQAFAGESSSDEILTGSQKEKFVKELAVVLNLGVHVVLPAQVLLAASETGRKEFLSLMLKAAGEASTATKSTIYFAGQGSPALKEEMFAYEVFRQNYLTSNLFKILLQDESMLGNRLKREAVSVSLVSVPSEEKPLDAEIPAFLIATENVDGRTESEKLQYLLRLIQLQLLAASTLKDKLRDSNREEAIRITGEFLGKIGIDFDQVQGFIRPSVESLLSKALTQYLETYKATARAA
ncbi:MAG: hypothetical protein NC930_05560 [Candidatus Omnitrophica bacterium]|nr:hypothetical protein [Candidatus Omnitrophota bacterium]